MSQSLDHYLTPSQVHPQFDAPSKKRALQRVAEVIANGDEAWAERLTDSLMARERLGSTGVGQGIAVPHCRSKELDEPQVHLFVLTEAIDFDALDGGPVDFLCVLLVPDSANELHLQLLRDIISTFADPETRAPLNHATDQQSLYDTAIELFSRHSE